MTHAHLVHVLKRIAMGLPVTGLALLVNACECGYSLGNSGGPNCGDTETRVIVVDRSVATSPTCSNACSRLPTPPLPAPGDFEPPTASGCIAPPPDAWARDIGLDSGPEVDADALDATIVDADALDAAIADASGALDSGLDGGESSVVSITCTYVGICRVAGRRPAGLARTDARSASVGAWLRDVAALEAASVPAFDELAHELTLHGAPRALVETARRSARDEVRHARLVGALARRHGAAPRALGRGARGVRDLDAVLVDNAAEGCVRESLGALTAAHQALTAADPAIRRAFASIARDEARHALFSHALHAWAGPRASRSGRAAADDAARHAHAALDPRSGITSEAARVALGLPNEHHARALFASIDWT